MATSASRVESAILRVQAATLRQAQAIQQAATANERYGATIASVATKGGDAASAQLRLSTAFDASTSAQTRAGTAALQVAEAYNKLGLAQDIAARNEQKLRAALDAPLKMPNTRGSSPAGSGSHGAGNYLLAGVGYQLGYDLLGQISQGFQAGLATQRSLATLGATTGIGQTPGALQNLTNYVYQTGSSGKQPFSPDVLSQGLYAIPSAGITDTGAIKAINDMAVKFSAFSGSTDTATATNALIQTMSAYGVSQKDMAAQVGRYTDSITAMVNLGIVQPADVASGVTTFGSAAAQNQIPFTVAAGMFAASTYTTRSSQQSAQDENAFIRSISNPNQVQRLTGKILGVSDLLGTQGERLLGSDPRKYFTDAYNATRLNPGLDLPKLFGTSNAAAFAMGLIGPGGGNLGRTFNVLGATSTPNTTNAAFAQYEKSPAAAFDNSVAAFKTAEQQFASAATPLAAALVGFTTSHVLDPLTRLIKNPSQPTTGTPGTIEYSQGGSVLHVSPTTGEGSRSPFGLLTDQVKWVIDNAPKAVGALDQVVSVGGHALGQAGNFIGSPMRDGTAAFAPIRRVLPTGYVGPLLPGEVRSGAYPPSGINASTPGVESIFGLRTMQSAQSSIVSGSLDQHSAQVASMQAAYMANQQSSSLATSQARLDALYGPNSTSRGGTARPPDITAAAQRITEAIGNNAGRNTVESALGLYRQTVSANPVLTAGTKAADILAQQTKVQRYERGMAGGADQAMLTAAQGNLDAAKQMGATPAALKQANDSYLNALRQFYRDTETGPKLAASLRGVDQQAAIAGYAAQGTALDRHLKDLQNQTAIDTARGNTGALGRDNAAVLAYQTAHAGYFKLDPSDIAALAAQNAAALLAQNPVINQHPFYDKQQSLGGLDAGSGSTLVRAGGVDPATQEIRLLRQELAAYQGREEGYLATIARYSVIRGTSTANNPHHGGMS